MFEALDAFLKAQDVKIEVKKDFPLRRISTIGIGGEASYVLYPRSVSQLVLLVQLLHGEEIPYIISGRMSNVLFSDSVYHGVVIRTDKLCGVASDGSTLFCECGVTLASLARACISEELTGLEELFGIPGSIGGSVIGNAGAFGREIADVIKCVVAYNVESEEQYVLNSSDMKYSYRSSCLKGKEQIVLGAQLSLAKSERSAILDKSNEYKRIRAQAQPIGEKSLGSIFKRCAERSAGELIDMCGLKGLAVNDAQISHKHAGFIVNNGNAAASDVVSLMSIARCEVKNKFGLVLEPEIVIM